MRFRKSEISNTEDETTILDESPQIEQIEQPDIDSNIEVMPENLTELYNRIITPDEIVRRYVPEITHDLYLSYLKGYDKQLIELFLDIYGVLRSFDLDYLRHAPPEIKKRIYEGKEPLPMDELRGFFAYAYFGRIGTNKADRGTLLKAVTTRRSEIETRQYIGTRQPSNDKKRKFWMI